MKNYACYGSPFAHATWATNTQKQTFSRPAANIFETETAFHVELLAPSMQKEDFKISVNNKRELLISAEKTEESNAGETQKFNHREFRYGTFKRVFVLPENVDLQNITAKYEGGILTVSIPKARQEKTTLEVVVA
jgi:HSP20 family protein